MATLRKYSKFFRFRTPVNVFDGLAGVRNHRAFWLTDAFYFIDFSTEVLVKESFLVMYYTKGGVTLKELKNLPFNEYEMFVKEALRLQKLEEQGNKDG